MRTLLAALALVPTVSLAAGAWQRFDMPGGYWEYDASSVVVLPDNQRRILARLTLSGMLKDPAGNHYDHAVYLIELDCAKRLRRVIDVVVYFRAERVEPPRTSEPWREMKESTLHKAACG